MTSESSLQNKYDRLCIEFNKLRRKHNEYKEFTGKKFAQLQECNKEKDARISELEHECEELRATLASKSELLRGIDAQAHTLPSASTNSLFCDFVATDQGSLQGAVNSVVPCASDNPVFQSVQPDDESCTVRKLITALHERTTAMSSCLKNFGLSEEQSVLVKRVGQLECEVSDLSVQLQLERRRCSARCKESSYQPCNTPQPLSVDRVCDISNASTQDNLMIEFLRGRVESYMERAQYFSSIASFLHDELCSVVPHLSCLAQELQETRSELHSSRATIRQLDAELEGLKSNTLKQNNEMAKHVANLTEELQNWRCSNRQHQQLINISPNSDSARLKKNSLLNVLKR